jgi:hypothetical protein
MCTLSAGLLEEGLDRCMPANKLLTSSEGAHPPVPGHVLKHHMNPGQVCWLILLCC